jgi:hypothetical protein
MNTFGPGIWRENGQKRKKEKPHDRTWNMARNTEKCAK